MYIIRTLKFFNTILIFIESNVAVNNMRFQFLTAIQI